MGRSPEKYYSKGTGNSKYIGVKELEEEEFYSTSYDYKEPEEDECYSPSYYSISSSEADEVDYEVECNDVTENYYPELSTPDDYTRKGKKHSNKDLINLLNELTKTNNNLSKEDEENKMKFYYFYDEIEKMLKEKSMSVLRLRTIATLSDLKEIYTKNINYITKLSFDKDMIKSYQEENSKILEETKELYETLISYHEKSKPESLKSYISAFKSLFK